MQKMSFKKNGFLKTENFFLKNKRFNVFGLHRRSIKPFKSSSDHRRITHQIIFYEWGLPEALSGPDYLYVSTSHI
jgi:hypothetical protein